MNRKAEKSRVKGSVNAAMPSKAGRLVGLGVWLVCAGVLLAGIALWERSARIDRLNVESARIHAAASQRVDQHDAHLTALSAVAIAGADQRPDLFLEVAGAIMRFYPRIRSILLLPLDGDGRALEAGPADADLHDVVRDAAARSTRTPFIARHPSDGPLYVIVKRSPNSDAAQYGLALVIDSAALLAGDSDYWQKPASRRRLRMPDGTVLFESGGEMNKPLFARPLASATQPLRLETAVSLDPASLFPPGRVAIALILLTLGLSGIRAALRQRARVRAAERQAELSGLETRLSHASRVNALGEMASGMAHELTQPLTAILAQSQAARHLAARGEAGKVGAVLEEVIAQTRRASAILERLRTWTRPQERRPERVDLRECVNMADTLLGRQASAEGINLDTRMPDAAAPVMADRIELEQVLFNLVKNALDAVAGADGERRVTVALKTAGDRAIIDVTDTGPGVRSDIRDRLFTPFVTTREDGTGLGLALSHRLIERAGGDIALVDRPTGAQFRIVLPLAEDMQEAAQ